MRMPKLPRHSTVCSRVVKSLDDEMSLSFVLLDRRHVCTVRLHARKSELHQPVGG
jgi:hypothetical protein